MKTFKYLLILMLLWCVYSAHAQPVLLDPSTQPRFVNTLPIPGVIDARSGGTYTITMSQFSQDLGLVDPASGTPMMTTVWGYNGSYPGPTIVAQKDVPVNIFWQNHLLDASNNPLPHLLAIDTTIPWAFTGHSSWLQQYGVPVVTHVHGGHTESASDGLPMQWFTPGFTQKGEGFIKGDIQPFHYDNDQEAATIWYHDHAMGITRLNVYAGLAGFYIVTDATEAALKAANKLPASPYDMGLAIQDRIFTSTGQLYYPSMPEEPTDPDPSVQPESFGSIILVNGKAWPVLHVEPRQYRFRLLDGSDSRFYNLSLSNGGTIWQVGSDNGLLTAPVANSQLLIAPGERKEVIIDFSNPAYWGTTIIVKNNAKAPYPRGTTPNPKNEGLIMAFRVDVPLNNAYPLTPVPTSLKAPRDPMPTATRVRKLILFEGTDEFGRLRTRLGTFDGGPMSFEDPVTETPKLDSTEIWEIYNLTADAHPIHLHLVAFNVLSTQKFKPIYIDKDAGLLSGVRLLGNPSPPAPGDAERKDTYAMNPGEVTRIKATFDREGLYVWHCHILSHEEHDMMRPYYVGTPPSSPMRPIVSDDHSPADFFAMFPNPVKDVINLQFTGKTSGSVVVRLYDMQGRLIKDISTQQQEGTNRISINSSDLLPGMYLCETKIGDHLYRQRMVKTAE